jgi:hypothetical protein
MRAHLSRGSESSGQREVKAEGRWIRNVARRDQVARIAGAVRSSIPMHSLSLYERAYVHCSRLFPGLSSLSRIGTHRKQASLDGEHDEITQLPPSSIIVPYPRFSRPVLKKLKKAAFRLWLHSHTIYQHDSPYVRLLSPSVECMVNHILERRGVTCNIGSTHTPSYHATHCIARIWDTCGNAV